MMTWYYRTWTHKHIYPPPTLILSVFSCRSQLTGEELGTSDFADILTELSKLDPVDKELLSSYYTDQDALVVKSLSQCDADELNSDIMKILEDDIAKCSKDLETAKVDAVDADVDIDIDDGDYLEVVDEDGVTQEDIDFVVDTSEPEVIDLTGDDDRCGCPISSIFAGMDGPHVAELSKCRWTGPRKYAVDHIMDHEYMGQSVAKRVVRWRPDCAVPVLPSSCTGFVDAENMQFQLQEEGIPPWQIVVVGARGREFIMYMALECNADKKDNSLVLGFFDIMVRQELRCIEFGGPNGLVKSHMLPVLPSTVREADTAGDWISTFKINNDEDMLAPPQDTEFKRHYKFTLSFVIA